MQWYEIEMIYSQAVVVNRNKDILLRKLVDYNIADADQQLDSYRSMANAQICI